MPELQKMQSPVLHLSVLTLFKEAVVYAGKNLWFCLSVLLFNFLYLNIFPYIDGGISNPLSIVWLVGYYIFWCVFYRYYYELRPYFFLKAVTSSLKPSTKAAVLLFMVMLLVAFLPMLPLFLGYDDVYLDFYEQYVQVVEQLSHNATEPASWKAIFLVYGLFSLIAPIFICKPYMSWIASLRRQSVSFAQVGYKMRGNYWRLVLVSMLLIFPEAIFVQAQKIWSFPTCVSLFFTAVVFVYTNIVFAKMYDFFYIQK